MMETMEVEAICDPGTTMVKALHDSSAGGAGKAG